MPSACRGRISMAYPYYQLGRPLLGKASYLFQDAFKAFGSLPSGLLKSEHGEGFGPTRAAWEVYLAAFYTHPGPT